MSIRSKKRESGTPDGAFGLIHRHLTTSIVALFEGYRLVVTANAPEPAVDGNREDVVVAIIGFASEHMRGSLVMTARASSIERWRGPFGEISETADLRDILGELANMVLGRLKGKLLREGLPILMSTPTTARGAAVVLAPSGGSQEQLTFVGDGWSLSARVDAAFDIEFGLKEEPTVFAAEAGDVMLF